MTHSEETYTTFFECGALVETVSASREDAMSEAEELHIETCTCDVERTMIGRKVLFVDEYSPFNGATKCH